MNENVTMMNDNVTMLSEMPNENVMNVKTPNEITTPNENATPSETTTNENATNVMTSQGYDDKQERYDDE